MSMVDFSRGEMSPMMRYRKDLEAYHKGVEVLQRFLPTSRGGLVRGPGCQVLELLPASDRAPAVRMFSLGSTGMDHPIPKVGESDTITIGTAVYDTEFRVHDIPKDREIDILMSFTEYGEDDDIVAYWVNTPDGNPAFYQRIWNYDGVYSYPAIDFDDTRDVRVVQVENNIYIIARTQIYRVFWDKNKSVPDWAVGTAYKERQVVKKTVGTALYFFECLEDHTGQDPATATGQDYWRVVYPPMLSWEIVSPRVGHELLKGIGTDSDPFEWIANTSWMSDTEYFKGDAVVVDVSGEQIVFECIGQHTTGTVTGKYPTGNTPAEAWEEYWVSYNVTDHPLDESITDDDKVYRRSTFAFREETVPREMVVHHNRLIFAGSSIRPSTIHGSEVYHYMNFGAGIDDDEPWIVTLSGDRVGRILWLAVTDQLYIGTSGGIFAVSGVITPNQFQLRKVTSHATSTVHAVAAAGSIIFFHKDSKTLREIEYADQAENYHAFDLTVFSDHLFEEFRAIKMVVVNDPSIIIWILREDGTLVSLSYEKTVGMYAFARHELHGMLYDIVAGKENELYGIIILPDTNVRQLVRIGGKDLTHNGETISNIKLDGLVSFVNTDNANLFATQILNESMRDWYVANGITSVSDMFDWVLGIDASESELTGLLSECGLNYLDEIVSLDLSGNQLSGEVPANLANLMSNAAVGASLNLSGNPVDKWEITKIPSTWIDINLSNTSFPIGQIKLILDSVLASLAEDPREGTIDLTGLGLLSADDALQDAVDLKAAGWTVLIDNAAGWDEEYVVFDGNGNTSGSAPSSIPCLFMEEIELPSEGTLVKTSHEFNGWAQGPTGAPTHQPTNKYVKNVEGSKTFYASWIPTNGVSYNGNGNTGGTIPSDGNLYNPGDSITVKSDLPTKLGHILLGWTLDSAGMGTVYAAGATITMGSTAITLYAKWQVNSYTLRFSLNGAQKGTVPAAKTQNFDTTYTLPSPTAQLHRNSSGRWEKFRRWNTKADGTGTPYNAGATYRFTAANVTLYAEFTNYAVGDTGPNGGVITQDLGSYARREFHKCWFNEYTGEMNPGADIYIDVERPGVYTWRYVEMMTVDHTSPRRAPFNKTEYQLVDGVYWYLPARTYLSTALTGGHLENLLQTLYWTGEQGKEGFWIFYDIVYYYINKDTGSLDSTKNSSNQYGVRLGRGI